MTSRTTAILAVALALGICLLLFILTTVSLVLRILRDRRLHAELCWKFRSQIQERQTKLDTFATLLDTDNTEDSGTSVYALPPSYEKTYHLQSESPLRNYTKKWISVSDVQEQRPTTADIARLEETLSLNPPMNNPLSIERDTRLFSNPQQYTIAEIAELLRSPKSLFMAHHILTATLLKNTSINGHPLRSLLPLKPEDIDGLYNFAAAVRNGLQLGDRLPVHMYRFGFYRPMPDSARQPYHEFFEAVFQPYFTSNLPQDVAERRTDLDEVFNAAVAHGMECLAFFGEVDYKWDEKKDGIFEVAPAMTCSNGRGGPSKLLANSDCYD